MTDVSIDAPATIVITHPGGTDTISVTVPDAPVTPPVGKQQYSVAVAGSGDWIIRVDGVRLDIDGAGTIYFGGTAIPGSAGAYAVGYDPATNATYRQGSATAPWFYWGGSMTDAGDWHTPSPPWVPPVAPPVGVPPQPITSTPRTRLLAYFDSLATHKCLIGQTSFPTEKEFDEVTSAFGFSPALMINDPWVVQWAGNAPFSDAFVARQLAHAKAGAIVGLSLMLPNPLTGNTSTSGGINLQQAATPGNPTNAGVNRLLDQGIGVLNQFKAQDLALPVRYMFELDGAWFWWGVDPPGGSRTNQQQTILFRYITDYLRAAGLADHILPTFAVNGGPLTYEYPGDDWVDIVGIDAYTSDLPKYKGQYDRLRQLAPSKPYILSEYGSGDPNGPDPNFDLTRLKTDIASTMPRCVMANFWSGWQPNKQRNGKQALSDPFWINKSQCVW